MTKLQRWLHRQGKTQQDVATALGITRQAVNQWLRGHTHPHRMYRIELEKYTMGAVKPRDWR